MPHLPWWGTLGLAVVALLIAPRPIGLLARCFFIGLFRAKGARLRNATAAVHGITPATAAAERDETAPRARSTLEVTIASGGEDGPLRLWEPGSLALAPPGLPPDDTSDEWPPSPPARSGRRTASCPTTSRNTRPQRLRLLLGVGTGVERLRLRYSLESFGGTFRLRPAAAAEPALAAQ